MRLVRALVPYERRSDVCDVLEDDGFDYLVTPTAGNRSEEFVVEIPVSDEAVGDVTDALAAAGVDLDRYTVVVEAELVATPDAAAMRDRYADVYDPPSRAELRSLVDKLNWDLRSFVTMMFLSAVVAAIGIVIDSPVVVVGSAVLAPFVNPMLITGAGTILGDRQMIHDSLRLQVAGLAVAGISAFAVGLAAEALALAPATLDLPAIDLVQARLAPGGLAVLVGVAAGAAAAVSLTAESSLINIVGVMVAAALVPAGAASGLAVAWGFPVVAIGSALLLFTTVVVINFAIVATFLLVGYRPSRELFAVPSRRAAFRGAAAALVLAVVVTTTGVATAGQVAFERDVNRAVDDVVSDPEYRDVEPVAVRSEYADYSPFTGPETVVVEVSRTDGESYPTLAARIGDRIAAETGREVTTRVELVDYQSASGNRAANE